MTTPGGYSAGTVFLQVVPSFRNFQNEVRKASKAAEKAFAEQLENGGDIDDAVAAALKKTERTAEKQGARTGEILAKQLQSKIQKAMGDLAPIHLELDEGLVEREAKILVARLDKLLKATVDLDIDGAKKVNAELVNIDRQLRALQGKTANVNVDTAVGKAIASLSMFERQVDALDRKKINIDVDVDSSKLDRFIDRSASASQSLRGFSGVALGVAALGPALIPVLAGGAAALTAFGTAALGAASGLGVMILGFSGVGEAVKQMGKVEEDAAQISERRRVASQRIADAQRGVADAERAAARAARDSAEANEEAARRISSARQNLARVEKDAARDIAAAARDEADARRALADAQEEAVQAAERSARDIAAAQQSLADATERAHREEKEAIRDMREAQAELTEARLDATRQAELAARRVEEAEENLARAVDRAHRDERDAIRATEEAREDLARTTVQAGRRIESALEAQRRAEERLTDSVRDAVEAQNDLNDARDRAARDLEDLNNDVISGRLDEEAAVLSLQDAQRDLNKLRQNPDADPLDIARAENSIARQIQGLEELRLRNRRLAAEQAEALAAGVEGSERVLTAQERLQDSLEAQTEAQNAIVRASENVADVRVEAARQIADAEQRIIDLHDRETVAAVERQRTVTEAQRAVADAVEASARQQVESAERVADAEQKVVDLHDRETLAAVERKRTVTEAQQDVADAVAEGARQQVDSARDISDAQRDVADVVARSALVQEDAAQRIKDAQQGVKDAVKDAADTQRDGAESIADAQRNVADAMRAVQEAAHAAGLEGSASVRNLQNAMDKLSPAGQRFAAFLFSLRDEFQKLRGAAQEGMLPGVERALRNILPFMPQITAFVATMAKTMGDLFEQASRTFTSPIWREFFTMMNQLAPTFAKQFGTVMLNLLTVFAQIGTAFAPLAVRIGDAMVRMTDGFVRFLDSKAGREALANFLGYVDKIAPTVLEFFSAFGRALGNLLIAIAPYGETFLKVLTGILNWIAEMDPKVLGAIVAGLAVLVVTFNILAGFVGVIGVLTSVVAGLSAVLAVGAGTAALIAGAVALVAVGLVVLYTRSETARDVVSAAFWAIGKVLNAWWEIAKLVFRLFTEVFTALVKGVTWLWENALKPTFEAFGRLVVYVWETYLKPTFELIGSVFKFLWETFLKPILTAIGALFLVVFTAIKFVWDTILWPVLKVLGEVVQFLWDFILKPILLAIGVAFSALATGMKWVFDNVLGPVIALIAKVVWELFKWAFEPVFTAIAAGWDATVTGIKWLWENALKPALAAIGKAWTDHLATPFKAAMIVMREGWEELKNLAKGGINFVIDTVLNKGLIAAFNFLADFFNTTPIKTIPLIGASKNTGRNSGTHSGGGYAAGGTVRGYSPTPTADNIPAMLTAGEYVIPVRAVQALKSQYGDQFLEWLRKGGGYATGGLVQRYAKGGLVEFGRLLQGRGFRVSEHPAFGGVRGRHAENSFHYSGQAIDVNYGPGGENDIEKAAIDKIVGLAKEYGLRTIWRAPGHFNHAHFDTGGSGGSIIGSIGSGIGGVISKVASWVSGFVNNPFGYLADKVRPLYGKLRDSRYGELLIGAPERAMTDARGMLGNMASMGADMLRKEADETAAQAKAAAKATAEAVGRVAGKIGFADGGHATLYDNGGMLPPGLTTVLNATGRPEPVFSPDQWAKLTAAGAGGGGGVQHIEGTLDLGNGLVGYVEGVIDGRERRELQAKRGRMG